MKEELYRLIPNMDTILREPEIEEVTEEYGKKPVMDEVSRMLDEIRRQIGEGMEKDELMKRIG
ncbi:MAG: hypothetical protein K6A69_04140, partial [Lachnospiraceae bacterium]|nr:hypothetical protein [Lachnospiraceae bacterium]